jgi:hypothetical protein
MSTITRTFGLDFPNRPEPEGGATEYEVSGWIVYAIGGPPTDEDVLAFLAPPTITPESNGVALDDRQKQTAKDEAAALAKSGDFEAAFSKLLELI